MSLSDLKDNSLYMAIYLRTDPHTLNNFHWALYLHLSPTTGGIKYHIRNQGDGWMTDHGQTAGIKKEFLLVGLVRIADIPGEVIADGAVDNLMRTFDGDVNTPGQTCRVWLFEVLKLLQQPVRSSLGPVRVLKCDDVEALAAEVMAWGNQHAQSAIENAQPRPVGESRVAGCC